MIDIIIPAYKRMLGLRQSLESINKIDDIKITIIDDCSNEDYTLLQKDFSYCDFVFLKENIGPGRVRQYGIEHTSEPYIYFLDAGDILLDSNQFLEAIKKYPDIKIFSWRAIDEYGHLRNRNSDNTSGYLYSRNFLTNYNISFCSESSYANEDFGFIHACWLILKAKNEQQYYLNIDSPIIKEGFDPLSLTKKNNEEFLFKDCVKGISLNTKHILSIGENNKIHLFFLIKELQKDTEKILFFYSLTSQHRPELLPIVKQDLKNFYEETYCKYLSKNKKIELLIS